MTTDCGNDKVFRVSLRIRLTPNIAHSAHHQASAQTKNSLQLTTNLTCTDSSRAGQRGGGRQKVTTIQHAMVPYSMSKHQFLAYHQHTTTYRYTRQAVRAHQEGYHRAQWTWGGAQCTGGKNKDTRMLEVRNGKPRGKASLMETSVGEIVDFVCHPRLLVERSVYPAAKQQRYPRIRGFFYRHGRPVLHGYTIARLERMAGGCRVSRDASVYISRLSSSGVLQDR